MEACEEFSENMELHADDVEYFYIESKRVTERREKEKESLKKEIGVLQEERKELRKEILDLKTENLQLREKLVNGGEVMGSKKLATEVTAQLVQGDDGGPLILLEGLQGVQLEESQVQFIKQKVRRELVKAQGDAKQVGEVPPTKVVLFLPSSVNVGSLQGGVVASTPPAHSEEILPIPCTYAKAPLDGVVAGPFLLDAQDEAVARDVTLPHLVPVPVPASESTGYNHFLAQDEEKAHHQSLANRGNESGQVVEELAFISVEGAGQEEVNQEEVKATIQENESGSSVSVAEENSASSFYSANSFLDEAKAVVELKDPYEEEIVNVPSNADPYPVAGEEKLGTGDMHKLVFGLSTRVVSKLDGPSHDLVTPLLDEPEEVLDEPNEVLDEPNEGWLGKKLHTKRSKAEPKKQKLVFEEKARTRRSSRRLSTLVSKFAGSPHSHVEVEDYEGGKEVGEMNKEVEPLLLKNIKELNTDEADELNTDEADEKVSKELLEIIAGGGVLVAKKRSTVFLETADEETRGEVKYHKKKGSREVFNSTKKTPKRKPTVVDEMVPKSSGKKRRNCLLGEDCLGCPAPECGECKHCLDKPSRGGRGTLKQKCILRKCRLDNASLDSASGSDMDVKA